MSIQRVATNREPASAFRPPLTWSGRIRAGDDFKLALTIYDGDDSDEIAVVDGTRSRLSLIPDQRPAAWWHDYGAGWATLCNRPVLTADGFTIGQDGRINFWLRSAVTAGLVPWRYRLFVQIDFPDGVFTELEGILQVTAPLGLGHVPPLVFQLDVTPLDSGAIIPWDIINGLPVDRDGFPLIDVVPAVPPSVITPPPPTGTPSGKISLNNGILNRFRLNGSIGGSPGTVSGTGGTGTTTGSVDGIFTLDQSLVDGPDTLI